MAERKGLTTKEDIEKMFAELDELTPSEAVVKIKKPYVRKQKSYKSAPIKDKKIGNDVNASLKNNTDKKERASKLESESQHSPILSADVLNEVKKDNTIVISKPKKIEYKPTSKVKRKKKSSLATNIAFSLVIVLLLLTLGSIFITKAKGEIPNIFGYYVFNIESGSMEDTLMVGEKILVKKTNKPQELEVDTIVTYKMMGGEVVTHRIVEVIKGENGDVFYKTKGDNPINSVDQELLSPNRVIGVFVLKFPSIF